MQTEYHKRAWKSYEKALNYRSILYIFSLTFMRLISCYSGTAEHKISYKLIKSEKAQRIFNTELSETIYPYVEFFWYFNFVLQAVLIPLAIKKHSICKLFFYMEILTDVVIRFLPYDMDWDMYMWGVFFKIIFIFVGCYFSFWPSLICSIGHLAF